MSNAIAKLSEFFQPNRVSWRVGSTNRDKTKGMALAYIDARDVMERLDETVGAANWQDAYTETARGRIICTLSIFVDGQWVSKSDGAGETSYEGDKGAISDAFKRAAVKWGIGRYLYGLDNIWVEIEMRGNTAVFTKAARSQLASKLPRPSGQPAPQRTPAATAPKRIMPSEVSTSGLDDYSQHVSLGSPAAPQATPATFADTNWYHNSPADKGAFVALVMRNVPRYATNTHAAGNAIKKTLDGRDFASLDQGNRDQLAHDVFIYAAKRDESEAADKVSAQPASLLQAAIENAKLIDTPEPTKYE